MMLDVMSENVVANLNVICQCKIQREVGAVESKAFIIIMNVSVVKNSIHNVIVQLDEFLDINGTVK